ncbi:hypothetical protein ACJMK2_023898 [Sinanodonta woodiana]|uniref:Uncharacterized protein n=1 Tax=Sinanodonta woodiana TaxID=1069815 RepID=A0ABD3T6G4_SINWO
MYLQALLPILCVASVAMMSTMSTTFKDVTNDFPALTTTNVPAMTTTNVPAMTTTNVSALTTTNVPASTTTNVPGLTTTYVPALTTTNVPALTTTNVPAMTTTNVPAMTTTNVPALTTTNVPALTTTNVPALTTTYVPALTTTNVPAMTTTNVHALTTTVSTEPNLCNKDLTFVCETPDEMTLSVLYPGFFTPASQETTFRKRRQSLGSCPNPNGSYAILQLGNDKDMCCIKYRQLRALCVIKDVLGVTYEVVHLLSLGLYQFLPYTSCGKSACSGQCLQQITPTSVLVWGSSQGFPWVKFTTVNLPTHCSCQNVGG